MVTTAVDQIRRSYFELFWYTHHLFIVFYVALCLHGSSGFVHKQTNFDQHPYYEDEEYLKIEPTGSCLTMGDTGCQTTGCSSFTCTKDAIAAGGAGADGGTTSDLGGFFCLTAYPTTFSDRCCPCYTDSVGNVDAIIVKGGPATWTWVIGPLLLYLGERFYRFYMSQTRQLQVLKIVKHNDTVPVMEVQITKVKTKAGQYAFLNCPDVSSLEWHPFTLTSCPRLDYISFHIRLVGDWTCEFADRCGFYRTEDEGSMTVAQLPKVAIDGPFGTSSEDIYRYDVGVCVCAGIGVTPFASLLQELYLRKFSKTSAPMRVKTIYFYWICPGFDSWGWFSNLLIEFEQKYESRSFPSASRAPLLLVLVRVGIPRAPRGSWLRPPTRSPCICFGAVGALRWGFPSSSTFGFTCRGDGRRRTLRRSSCRTMRMAISLFRITRAVDSRPSLTLVVRIGQSSLRK
jgi:hypothetical protein